MKNRCKENPCCGDPHSCTLNTRPAAPVEGLDRYAPKPCDEMQESIGMDRHKHGDYVRFDQAVAIIAAKDNEILALRRAIMNGDPDLILRHESFIEMAATLHRACDGGRERAEKAEADNAALTARVRELENKLTGFCEGI